MVLSPCCRALERWQRQGRLSPCPGRQPWVQSVGAEGGPGPASSSAKRRREGRKCPGEGESGESQSCGMGEDLGVPACGHRPAACRFGDRQGAPEAALAREGDPSSRVSPGWGRGERRRAVPAEAGCLPDGSERRQEYQCDLLFACQTGERNEIQRLAAAAEPARAKNASHGKSPRWEGSEPPAPALRDHHGVTTPARLPVPARCAALPAGRSRLCPAQPGQADVVILLVEGCRGCSDEQQGLGDAPPSLTPANTLQEATGLM